MGKFAKLYERDGVQALVMIDTNDKGGPQVKIYTEPEGLGVCSIGPSWDDTPDLWDAAEKYFNSIDEGAAFAAVQEIENFYRDTLGEE